jgi:hypothetical protein
MLGKKTKDNLKVGKPHVSPDKASHTKGVKSAKKGHYKKQLGHEQDGRSTAKRSTGIDARHHSPIDPRMPNLSPP